MKASITTLMFIWALIISLPPVSADDTNAEIGYTSEQCNECHEEMAKDHFASVHKTLSCPACHPGAVKEDHEAVEAATCSQCHGIHREKIAHDAHSRVDCNACHVEGGIPEMDPESDRVVFSGSLRYRKELSPHGSIQTRTTDQCIICHFRGNSLGASAMVLPPKSVLCMPCHASTFSVGDKTTLISLLIFLIGMGGLAMVWFSGSSFRHQKQMLGDKHNSITPRNLWGLSKGKMIHLFKVLFTDVILLQRLYRISPTRWIIHGLIFLPILFRLLFGLLILFFSIFFPESSVTAAMLDKNSGLSAFLFDITGVMILIGATAAMIRRKKKNEEKIVSIPGPGPWLPGLIVLMIVVGFILEGMRMAMTGRPAGVEWAFLGYAISLFVKGMPGLTDLYGYVWYAHGILAGLFLALIPFTRMSHIITAPMVLILDAWADDDHRKK